MMPQGWLILADDLTGAADCAIAFARRGLPASVGWHGVGAAEPVPAGPAPSGMVLAVDADSRRLPPAEAAARHVGLLAARHTAGLGLIKKIDSTLRGQPVAELAATCRALRQAGRPALAIVAPAFPATGRTTEGGRVHMNGTRLEDTPLWARDHSYDSALLPELLAAEGLATRHLPLETVRDPASLTAALRAALAEGAEAVVCDAVAVEDLAAIAQASLPLAGDVFWVGSGGIAAALAAALPGTAEVTAPPALPHREGGMLVVVGSVAEASRAAAARLLAENAATLFDIPAALLRAGPADPRWQPLSTGIATALSTGQDTLVRIAAEPRANLAEGAALAERLADLLAPAARHMAGLFATGGETACALLTHLGVHGIRLLDELEPGVPLGITQGALAVPVMTKAGAFGHETTILNSLARLRALPRA